MHFASPPFAKKIEFNFNLPPKFVLLLKNLKENNFDFKNSSSSSPNCKK